MKRGAAKFISSIQVGLVGSQLSHSIKLMISGRIMSGFSIISIIWFDIGTFFNQVPNNFRMSVCNGMVQSTTTSFTALAFNVCTMVKKAFHDFQVTIRSCKSQRCAVAIILLTFNIGSKFESRLDFFQISLFTAGNQLLVSVPSRASICQRVNLDKEWRHDTVFLKKMGPPWPLFLFLFYKLVLNMLILMSVLRISGVGSNRSTNCATTTALKKHCYKISSHFYCSSWAQAIHFSLFQNVESNSLVFRTLEVQLVGCFFSPKPATTYRPFCCPPQQRSKSPFCQNRLQTDFVGVVGPIG